MLGLYVSNVNCCDIFFNLIHLFYPFYASSFLCHLSGMNANQIFYYHGLLECVSDVLEVERDIHSHSFFSSALRFLLSISSSFLRASAPSLASCVLIALCSC